MLKVALIADIHIRVDSLPVEVSWNYTRLKELAEELNTLIIDEVWIIGDLFDRSLASMSDIISAKHFIDTIEVPVKYLNGNHERADKDNYTLDLLKSVLNIEALPEFMETNGVSINCIGYDSIHKIKTLPPTDLLLTHLRWSHDLFGKGELGKADENFISKNFKQSILGDIHYPYEPEDNVTYISSPYSINYGTPKDYGLIILELDKGDFKFERKTLDLPCKISTTLPLAIVNGFIKSTDAKHLYRIIVKLRHNQMEDFKKIKFPKNIESIPQFIEGKLDVIDVKPIEISGNIKEVLIDSLKLEEEGNQYIREILKEN